MVQSNGKFIYMELTSVCNVVLILSILGLNPNLPSTFSAGILWPAGSTWCSWPSQDQLGHSSGRLPRRSAWWSVSLPGNGEASQGGGRVRGRKGGGRTGQRMEWADLTQERVGVAAVSAAETDTPSKPQSPTQAC